jgi:hypothetical protein
MGTDPKSVVSDPRDTLDVRPRTTSTARVREVWDARLRASERDLVLQLAGYSPALKNSDWSKLDANTQRLILIALRDLVQLGNEASYALGYSRRNGG